MDNKLFIQMCQQVVQEAAAIAANDAKIKELQDENLQRESTIGMIREQLTGVIA